MDLDVGRARRGALGARVNPQSLLFENVLSLAPQTSGHGCFS